MTNKQHKQDIRRLNFLCSTVYTPMVSWPTKFDFEEELKRVNTENHYHFKSGYKELLNLFWKLDYRDGNEVRKYWFIQYMNQKRIHSDYQKKPTPIKKDNKDYLSKGTSRHSNRNTVRYPRKCRKTAWKRFYKLFPNLKPQNDVIDR